MVSDATNGILIKQNTEIINSLKAQENNTKYFAVDVKKAKVGDILLTGNPEKYCDFAKQISLNLVKDAMGKTITAQVWCVYIGYERTMR